MSRLNASPSMAKRSSFSADDFKRKEKEDVSTSIGFFELHEELKTDWRSEKQEAIRNAAGTQNADGTFGSKNEIMMKTSLFIIGMLSLKNDWKPYRIQILKAGKALMICEGNDFLYKAAALFMVMKNSLSKDAGMTKVLNESIMRLSDEEKLIFDSLESGNVEPFAQYATKLNMSGEESAVCLLSQVVKA